MKGVLAKRIHLCSHHDWSNNRSIYICGCEVRLVAKFVEVGLVQTFVTSRGIARLFAMPGHWMSKPPSLTAHIHIFIWTLI